MATAKPDVTIERITPKKAEEYLGHNIKNRNIRRRDVDAIARDMKSGDWDFNGESIKFDTDGSLSDGQHRLLAIVESGTTQQMVVVRNIRPEAQDSIDTGAGRKLHDVLKLRGEVHGPSLAAALRLVTLWKNGYRSVNGANFRPTNPQCLATLDKHPELRDHTRQAVLVANNCDLPGSVAALCIWLFNNIDSEDCAHFFERLSSEVGHVKGDPIYELRRTLANSRDHRSERSRTWLLAITIKAWNAYRDGEPVSLYKFRSGGSNPEKFPEPR